MKFSSLTSLFFFALPLAALADTVAYDETYDDASTSLDVVACSDGANGIETKFGFKTFGQLPHFPLIGAAGAVAGFNSPNCGTCWQLTYTNGSGAKKSINIIAVDHAAPGTFNVALAAMNTLTGGEAVELGRVNVVSTQVAASVCGL